MTTLPGATAGVTAQDAVEDPPPPLPDFIVCGTQYRSDLATLEGAEEPVLRTARKDGLMPSRESVDFATMSLTVSYWGEGPEGRTVNVEVTSAENQVLFSTLYQIGDVPIAEIDFAGGHGFTGLNYVYQDSAVLQFWCTAE